MFLFKLSLNNKISYCYDILSIEYLLSNDCIKGLNTSFYN